MNFLLLSLLVLVACLLLVIVTVLVGIKSIIQKSISATRENTISDMELLEQAKRFRQATKKVTASALQRRFHIGFARANWVLDQLQDS